MRTRILAVVAALMATIPLAGSPASALPDWTDTRSAWHNPEAKQPRVLDLRYATHKNFDRVVIDIAGALPGGRAIYRKKFHYDGSGATVPIGGASGLQVALNPAYAHDDDGDGVYVGPRIARPRFDTLKALAFTGDYEGYVSFAFALTHRAEYRVFRLHEPQRLVIDFRHE